LGLFPHQRGFGASFISRGASSCPWLIATFHCLVSVAPASVDGIQRNVHHVFRSCRLGGLALAGLVVGLFHSAPVVASGSVHAGDPSGGPVVSAFGCLPGQRISSGEPVHAGDPSGGPVVPARMGLGCGFVLPGRLSERRGSFGRIGCATPGGSRVSS
jgi:hypothetical protein